MKDQQPLLNDAGNEINIEYTHTLTPSDAMAKIEKFNLHMSWMNVNNPGGYELMKDVKSEIQGALTECRGYVNIDVVSTKSGSKPWVYHAGKNTIENPTEWRKQLILLGRDMNYTVVYTKKEDGLLISLFKKITGLPNPYGRCGTYTILFETTSTAKQR
jgi:hypothetical protein